MMFSDMLGLHVSNPEILMFKSLLTRFYRVTYTALLPRILAGPVVHADETSVKLRTGKGYVWVLVSPEEVVFLYRPTREAEFLQNILRDFQGVLVSDFLRRLRIAPVPATEVPDIHLIRDINQDLLNNPFDEDFRVSPSRLDHCYELSSRRLISMV
jgi:hypothetical protein